jgi:hypothetical protein
MDKSFLINTLHQLRAGIDLIGKEYKQETCFAYPTNSAREGKTVGADGRLGI